MGIVSKDNDSANMNPGAGVNLFIKWALRKHTLTNKTMEILGYIPETIWIASLSFLGGCLAVFLAHHLSVRDRRYNRKLDVILLVARNVNAYLLKESNSETNLIHSLNEAMIIFSSDKIREAILNFQFVGVNAVSIHKVDDIITLMCRDINSKLEFRSRNQIPVK